MKVLVLLMCAVAIVAADEIVAWPGAIPIATSQVKTITPGQIKGFGFSTSQYINAIPSAPFGYQPQFSYQISIPSYHPAQTVVGASYFPLPIAPLVPASPILPAAPIAPIQSPIQNIPSQPAEQPAGDEDSAVIESADSPYQQSSQSPPSLDTKNMPGFPQVPLGSPQIPPFPQRPEGPHIPLFPPFSQAPQQKPTVPQFPQGSQQNSLFSQFAQGAQPNPSIPQILQGSQVIPLFPQNSQGSLFPQYPQVPQQTFPQIPQYQQPGLVPQQPQLPASASFPSSDNSDKGLNDEDTVSVESA